MAWCSHLLPMLAAGETVQTRPRGNSMTPRIKSGELCTIAPIPAEWNPTNGDIVLCKVRGSYYLHIISASKTGQVQISNNHGHVNGWTSRSNVYGVLTSVSP
jgi:phage repressor protein C with HTH and peptisase S24 domain